MICAAHPVREKMDAQFGKHERYEMHVQFLLGEAKVKEYLIELGVDF
jgi:hypothetical protein